MAYTKYSLTPANNTAAPPDGAPEGMLPSAVNDTMRDMMAQIRDCGDGVRDGTYTMTAPKITGGTITGVTLTGNTLTNPVITGATLTTSAFNGTVGATTASTGAFTTLSTSSTTTFSGLTASTALALDASKNVVSVTNTGTGNNVLSASPTLTGTIAGASLSLSSLTSGRVTYAGASGLLSDSANFVYDSSERLIVGASSAAIGNRMEVVSNTGSQAIGIRGRVSDGAGVISWHPNASATEYARIQSDSNSALIFGTGSSGTERMRITSAGNVGIGTSSPVAKLDVYGGSANTSISVRTDSFDGTYYAGLDFSTGGQGANYPQAQIKAVGANNYSANLIFSTQNSGTTNPLAPRMTILSNGNVGINTTDPDYGSYGATERILGVTGVATNRGRLSLQNTSTGTSGVAGTIAFFNGSTTLAAIDVNADGATNKGLFAFNTNNGTSVSERMRLDSSGNLLVGTTTPVFNLAGRGLITINGSSAAAVGFTASGVDKGIILHTGTDMIMSNSVAGAITFQTTNTERARIDASGNLLVGTTSTITGTKFGATSTTTSGAGEFYVNSAGADAINAINIIKYSTTNTTAQQFIGFTINNANTGSGQINANGASQAAFGSFSDARLKENIVDLPSQLNNILALKPKEFDYIQSEGGGHQIGFVAQDMQTVYPDAISERTDGMLVVTGWSKTEARLVKAIQEQQALIESLTTRLTALESK